MEIAEKINKILKDYSLGNKFTAYKRLKKIFVKYKTNNKIRYNLAIMEKELGYIDLAKKNFKFLIDSNNHIQSMINYYLIEIQNENFINALKIINIALKIDNLHINILRDKAFVMYKINNFEESQKICLSILNKNTNDDLTLNILGLNYFGMNKIKEAEKIFLEGLKIKQDSAALLNSLGRLYHETRQAEKAEKAFLKAIKIKPTSYANLNNIAGFYLEEGFYKKSISYYKKADDISPNNAIILMNLAKSYLNLNKTKIAEDYCIKALKINEFNDDIKKTFSMILFKNQEYSKAWNFFDGRLNLSDFSIKNSSLVKVKSKIFKGNKLLKDKKILILREQGVGDEILYGTMYGDLLSSCENVTIECDERLLSIFQNSFDKKHKDKFLKLGSVLNDEKNLSQYDYVLYAGSLGRFFRNNINDFNKNSYLILDKNIIEETKKKINNFDNRYNIGVSWKSFKNRYAKEKSLALSNMLNLFKTPNCNFINLQYGDVSDEIYEFCLKYKITIHTINNIDLYNDLNGVGSLLKNLDLFVSVSNSTAHLAGALGVRTLLIKPYNHATYHYWNQPTFKTPWYNSIRLIDKKNFIDENNIIEKYLT